MAFQAVPNVAHVTVEGSMDRQLTIIDLDFEISGGGITPTNLNTLVLAVDTWAHDSLSVQLSEDWSYVRSRAIDLSVPNGAVAESSSPATGGVASEAAPNNVAMCVTKVTGFSGRSFRGRNYIPGIPNAAVTLNTIDNTFIVNMLIIMHQLVGAGTFEAGWQLGVVSRQTAGALRPSGIISPVIQYAARSPYVRSMRSREVGHGA